MRERIPAEAFFPGDFVKEEIDARGWTQTDLAEVLGVSFKTVNEMILGKRSVTPTMAKALGEAFGTKPQLWLNLESAYQLWKLRTQETTVARRSRLYSIAPLKEMIKRHWLEDSDNIDVLEKRTMDFFGLSTLDEEPRFFSHATRRSTPDVDLTPSQCAWMFRARQLASVPQTKRFSENSLERCFEALRPLLVNPEDTRLVPRVLADAGIRFVVVEQLKHSKIDGATFWLNRNAPVIAVSLRFDRLDWFWFTLIHELIHVRRGDGRDSEQLPDVDLVGDRAQRTEDKSRSERAADTEAARFLVPSKELTGFIKSVKPLYSRSKIHNFAARIKVHPGLVVGQLQHTKEIPYAHSRDMLAKVRKVIIESSLTDGWGHLGVVKQ